MYNEQRMSEVMPINFQGSTTSKLLSTIDTICNRRARAWDDIASFMAIENCSGYWLGLWAKMLGVSIAGLEDYDARRYIAAIALVSRSNCSPSAIEKVVETMLPGSLVSVIETSGRMRLQVIVQSIPTQSVATRVRELVSMCKAPTAVLERIAYCSEDSLRLYTPAMDNLNGLNHGSLGDVS